MGCEDVVSSVGATAKGSGLVPVDSKTLSSGEDLTQVCVRVLDQEAQVNDETSLLESAQQNRRVLCREDEFPSSDSLCGVKIRKTSKRAASLDFLECMLLPYEEIAQLGCKSGGKSFWKNLRFWHRTEKTGAASYRSVVTSPSVQHSDLKLAGPKLTRAKREVLGPLYTDGTALQNGSRKQQHPYAATGAQTPHMCGKRDGNVCAYMPLNRFPRIPPGPLYLP